ncbi:MAG: rsbU 7 [Ignavibacteria bacterium]|nr:rsbU 7 [Ignavibacteria bacterium]
MSVFDKKPLLFKIFILSMTGLFFIISLVNFTRTILSPTDENMFQSSPSNIYVKNDIPAEYITPDGTKAPDTISGGSLILFKSDQTTSKELFEKIQNLPDTGQIKLITFKLSNVPSKKYFKDLTSYIVTKKELTTDRITYLKSAILIRYVVPGGASDMAGIKVGDIIVSINGQNFSSDLEADRLMRMGNKGTVYKYEIMRGNKDFVVNVVLAKIGVPFQLLFIFISSLISFGIALFFGIKRAYMIQARWVSIALTFLGFWIACSYTGFPMNYDWFNIFKTYLHTIVSFFTVPVIIISLKYFPSENKILLKRKFYSIFNLTIPIIGCIFSIIGLIFFPRYEYYNLLLTISIFITSSFSYIYSRVVKSKTRDERRLTRTIGIVLAIAVIISVISVLYGIFSVELELPFLLQLAVLFTFLIPLSFLYTAAKYNLLGIELKFGKNIQYEILSWLCRLAAATIIIFCLTKIIYMDIQFPNLNFTGKSIEVLDHPLSNELQRFYLNLTLIIVSVLVIAIIIKLTGKLLKYIDRKFYRMKFDYRQAAAKLAEISEPCCTEDLIQDLTIRICDLIRIKHGAVLTFKNESIISEQFYNNFDGKVLSNSLADNTDILVNTLLLLQGGIRAEYMPSPIKEAFSENGIQFLYPVRSKGKILGLILIGEKLSETPFNSEDYEFLQLIANQTAISIENSILYEDLAQQERMKHELEIARRIQIASLPKNTPSIEGLDIFGVSLPAYEVGGDFFDYLDGNQKEITVVVGDVSGKGTSSALYMSKAQGILRTLHEFCPTPYDLMLRTNKYLYGALEKSSFITALGIKINMESRTFDLVRAGHLPFYHFESETGLVQKITPRGIALGIEGNNSFQNHLEEITVKFNSGDIFLLISDGIIEARNNLNEEFEESRVLDILSLNSMKNAEEIVKRIVDSVTLHTGSGELYDDITAVVIKAL